MTSNEKRGTKICSATRTTYLLLDTKSEMEKYLLRFTKFCKLKHFNGLLGYWFFAAINQR